jgi:regulatory protein
MHFMFLPLCFIIENMEELLTITAIEPQKRKRDRYNIYADGDYIASLGAEAIVRAGIKAGASIRQSALDEAVLADNVQYAFDSAIALVARGMRTRGDLEQRLRERGIAEAAVAPAMDKLTAYGYVDDIAYAREFVRSDVASGRWGRMAVAQRLREKKLPREIIDEAMRSYTEEDEKRSAKRQLDALVSKSTGDKRQLRQKAYAVLTRHGFSYDIISALFSEADD